MTTFEWISVDDQRKPEIAEGEGVSDDILVAMCNEHGYWCELGWYCRSGSFLRHDDQVHCVIRYWAPLLVPPFPPSDRLPVDLKAVKLAFKKDAEECRRANRKSQRKGE